MFASLASLTTSNEVVAKASCFQTGTVRTVCDPTSKNGRSKPSGLRTNKLTSGGSWVPELVWDEKTHTLGISQYQWMMMVRLQAEISKIVMTFYRLFLVYGATPYTPLKAVLRS